MASREVAAAVRLLAQAGAGLASRVEEVHTAVAERVFTTGGAVTRPVRDVHDAIASTVYSQVRIGFRTAATAAGLTGAGLVWARATDPVDARPVSLDERPVAGAAMALLNGWTGDRLQASGNVLATSMTVRAGGRPVDASSPDELAAAFGDATGRIAVFVHGLVETERSWTPRAAGRRSFAGGLAGDLGFTPVLIRYNTGLHISENARHLGRLLGELTANWPVPVSDLVLIGHSMGGLVGRSALHHAELEGASWTGPFRALVTLGSPHLGAPLERVVNEIEHALRRLPESAPLAAVLRERSSGIQDLRFGNLLDGDWEGREPGHRRNERMHVPLTTHPHFLLYGTLGRRTDGLLSDTVGDLLVLPRSATGRGRRHPPWELPASSVRHVPRATHFDLLHHPEVYLQLREWLRSVLPQG